MSSILTLLSFSTTPAESSVGVSQKFFSPLDLYLKLKVQETVLFPRWTVLYQADMSSEAVEVLLLDVSSDGICPSGGTLSYSPKSEGGELSEGVLYSVTLHISNMQEKLSCVKEKYLQQASVIRVRLFSKDIMRGELCIVCQPIRCAAKTAPLAAWNRQIYSPLA